MVSDVPVGVLLSGGIDSSLVVALLAEQGQTGLATFSIGFESAGGESGDEFEYSSLVARRFGTDHSRIRIDDARLLPGLDGAVAAMSEPMVSHEDRKSTRLNSSHANISYAVFCLQKKKFYFARRLT